MQSHQKKNRPFFCKCVSRLDARQVPWHRQGPEEVILDSQVLMFLWSPTHPSVSRALWVLWFFFFCDECIWRTLEGPLWLHHAHAGSHDYADGRSTRECECALVSCQALVQGTQHFLQVQFPQDDNVQPQRLKFEFLKSGIPNLPESWSPQSISIWMSYVGS